MCQCATRRQNNYIYLTVHLRDLSESDFLYVFPQISCHPVLPASTSFSLSLLLEQDFLYFSTLLSVHSKLCCSNRSSHVPSLLFVAAAVLKQVLVAIWPASMLLDGIALLCDTGKEREIKCCKERH